MRATACTALAMLLATTTAFGQEQRWCALEVGSVRIMQDGTAHLWASPTESRNALRMGLDPDGTLFSSERVLLVHDDVVWTLVAGVIVGSRAGVVFTNHALGDDAYHGPLREAARDHYGRVWFATPRRLYSFDGEAWKARELGLGSGRSTTTPTHITTSSDARSVYVWREGGEGFVVVAGPGPEITRVDESRGLSFHALWWLRPVGPERVLAGPGLDLLPRARWREARPFVATTGVRPETGPRALGRYELEHCRPLDSDDSHLWLQAQKASLRASPAAPAEPVITCEHNLLFKLDAEAHIERATPTWEAFQPEFVDRFGVGWRRRGGSELARLEGDQAWLLVDAETRTPVAVSELAGVDTRGRAFFKLASGGWYVNSPAAPARPEDRFAWQPMPITVWTPALEPRALERVTALVAARDLNGAAEIAGRFGNFAFRSPEALRETALWRELSSALSLPRKRGSVWSSLSLARAASALDLDELTRTAIEAVLESVEQSALQRPTHSARAAGRIASEHGWHGLARDAYTAALRPLTEDDSQRSFILANAVRAAVHARDYPQALEWLAEQERISRTWQLDLARVQAERVRALLADVDEVDAQLLFVQEFWLGNGIGQSPRHADGAVALASILERFEPTRDQRRTLLERLQEATAKAGDMQASTSWSERLVREFDDEPETVARSLTACGRAFVDAGEPMQGLELFQRVSQDLRGTPSWGEAKYYAGRVLMQAERREQAILAFELLLDEGFEDCLYLHNAAELTSQCYEELGRFEPALRYAQAAVERYPMQSTCGSCSDNEAAMNRARIERLKALLK